ncbi:hypothetical protein [Methylovulum psychrotolerans]|uniref:hypothetical protein n=1 Tax=Methylovulum psychrotolerans TaxID=1704499 RepID=UPI0014756191|nr:hypothetical protein [Methylovulum psychrotolerans]
MGEWVGDKASELCRLLMAESGVSVQAVTETTEKASGWNGSDPGVGPQTDGSGTVIS